MTAKRMDVHTARPADLAAVMNVLDGAALESDVATVREHSTSGEVLVATEQSRVLGALVRSGTHVEALAVRRSRRGQGIGTKLVEAATNAADGDVTAEFDAGVKPFYESLDFTIEPTDEPGRFRGRR